MSSMTLKFTSANQSAHVRPVDGESAVISSELGPKQMAALRKTDILVRSIVEATVRNLSNTYSFDATEALANLETGGLISHLVTEAAPSKRGPKAEGPTQAELRARCTDLRVPITGNKTQLIERIAAAESGTLAPKEETTAELKAKCLAARLPISGTKAELIQRLSAFETGNLASRPDTQQELKAKCQQLGWPITGNKSTLIGYLEAAARGESPPSAAKGPSTRELKEEAAKLGCPITGNKTVLLERIAAAKSAAATNQLVANHMTASMTASPVSVSAAGSITSTGFVFNPTESSAVAQSAVEPIAVDNAVDNAEVDDEDAEVEVTPMMINGFERLVDQNTGNVYHSAEDPHLIGSWTAVDGFVPN